MVKKISGTVLLALMLVLAVTSVAFAATNGFGILNFHPEQAENKTYVEHIVSIDQTWKGEYFTASMNEAVFDGMKLAMMASRSSFIDSPVLHQNDEKSLVFAPFWCNMFLVL